MTDYDETRARRGKRQYRTVSDGKPLMKIVTYLCPKCGNDWATADDERELKICRKCGAVGVRV